MDAKENEQLQLLYAETVYKKNVSFNAMTGDDWIKFFKRIRPKFIVPSRDQLANELLDKTYDRVKDISQKTIVKSDYVSLVIDGWTNIRRDAVINIVLMTPTPIFYESIDTQGATKDADYMFDILKPIIIQLGPAKVTGLISDNEPKMISLKDKVIAEFKHIQFSGCVSHKFSNLIKKICDLDQIKTLVEDTEQIVFEIKNTQKLHAKYRSLIAQQKGKKKSFGELKTFSKTRFAGTAIMMKSVINAMDALRVLAADPENNVSEGTKMKVMSMGKHKEYVAEITLLVDFLDPLKDFIHCIEYDCFSIADMIHSVKKLEEWYLNNDIHFGSANIKIDQMFKDTINSVKTPSALLANILHPFYRGEELSTKEKSTAAMFVNVFARQLNMDVSVVMKSYQNFINGEFLFSQQYLFTIDTKNAISWWKFIKNISEHKSLCEMAHRLLCIQPTNTAVERSFSQQKRIHSIERYLLTAERVYKLMYIRSNLNASKPVSENVDRINPNVDDFIIVPETDLDSEDNESEDDVMSVHSSN